MIRTAHDRPYWMIYFIIYFWVIHIKEAGGQGLLSLDLSWFNSEKKYVPSVRNGLYRVQYCLPALVYSKIMIK